MCLGYFLSLEGGYEEKITNIHLHVCVRISLYKHLVDRGRILMTLKPLVRSSDSEDSVSADLYHTPEMMPNVYLEMKNPMDDIHLNKKSGKF